MGRPMATGLRGRWNILLIAFIFGLLAGCGHMPVTAMVKLTRDVDLRSFEAARDIAAMLPECR
jgi:hypothetical protein